MPFRRCQDYRRGTSRNPTTVLRIRRLSAWKFVWDPDTQVTRLFDSLMRNYPIGGFLSWVVRPPVVSEFKWYGFMRNYHQLDSPHCPEIDLPGDQAVTAVLDGQQRLTALNIGLRGSHAKRRKYGWRENPNAYPTRRLYLNLLSDAPENDLGMQYDFRFFEEQPLTELAPPEGASPAFWIRFIGSSMRQIQSLLCGCYWRLAWVLRKRVQRCVSGGSMKSFTMRRSSSSSVTMSRTSIGF